MHRQLPIHQEVCQPIFGRRDVTKLQPGLPFCHPRAATDDFSALLFGESEKTYYICIPIRHRAVEMVDVAQSVRASDCGSEGRGFEPLLPPYFQEQGVQQNWTPLFCRDAVKPSPDFLVASRQKRFLRKPFFFPKHLSRIGVAGRKDVHFNGRPATAAQFEPLLPPYFSRTRRPTKLDAFVLSGKSRINR